MNDTLDSISEVVTAAACFSVSCCLSSLRYNKAGKLSVTQGEEKGGTKKKTANRVDEKRTRGKRVKVRENLAIIGCVERTKAIVVDVALASITSVSRFSFFEKKNIYIKVATDWSLLCCHDCVIVSLFQSERKKKKKEKISGQTRAHTHTIYTHVHKLVIIIILC